MRSLWLLFFFLSAAVMAGPLHFNDGEPPVIDGREDAAWQRAEALALSSCPPGRPVNMATTVKIMYDSHNLYFFFRCREVNLVEARQQERFAGHDAAVWNNDCVEILIDAKNNARSYYQFVVDVHNSAADFLHYDPEWNRENLEWNGVWQHAVGTYDDGWTMEAAIPWSTLGFGIFDTGSVRLNISRVRRIAPFERLVLASNGNKFHDLGCFLVYDNLKLVKPPLKAEIKSEVLFLGGNQASLLLDNTSGKPVSGTVELSLQDMTGKKLGAHSSEIAIDAGRSGTFTLPCEVVRPGDYRLALSMNGSILAARHYTVRELMEICDPRPVVIAGEPYSFFLRIYSGRTREPAAVLSDASGKEVQRSTPGSRGDRFFWTVPTGKLPPGEYTLRISLEDYTARWPLLIVPAL